MKKPLSILRDEKGLTQRQLAIELSKNRENLSFSHATIALYERGLRTPSLKRAKVIARYFGVPVESIIFGNDAYELKAKKHLVSTGAER